MTRQVSALSAWAALLGAIGACGGTDPSIPLSVSLSPTSVSFTALGQTQQLVPSVTDQDGNAVSGANVSWSSSSAAVATVSSTGLVTAIGAGSADVTATSASATATAPVTVAQTPTQLLMVSGDDQAATAGTTLPAPLVVQVNDAGGNPIPGRTATFTVSQGGGTTGAASVVTGADGRASTTFTIGTASGFPQEVSVSIAGTALSESFTATVTAAADPASFNIGLQYLSTVTPSQHQAFTTARLRWEGVITQDLEDGLLDTGPAPCGPGSPAVNQDVDDVVILVSVVPIDGADNTGVNTVASAGPCFVRDFGGPAIDPGDLTILGTMQFDIADLQALETDGLLSDVVLHEMGHVLGFGTLWGFQGFLADPRFPDPPPAPPAPDLPNPGADPHFTGAQGIAAFDDAGGAAYIGGKVPVENTGGRGQADGHWRESVMDNELMTTIIVQQANPLSRMTIASLADQGYAVDLAAADAFSFLLSLRAFDTRPKLLLKNDIRSGPIKRVDRRGRIIGELRR